MQLKVSHQLGAKPTSFPDIVSSLANTFSSSTNRTRWILAGCCALAFVVLQALVLSKNLYGYDLLLSSSSGLDSIPTVSRSHLGNGARLGIELNSSFNKVVTENPLTCKDQGKEPVECCASWDINVDDWWLHKPDWEVTRETATSFCLGPIQIPDKAEFLQNLHDRQWADAVDCNKVETSVQMNSGFGASIRWLLFAFWHAQLAGIPFQIEWSERRWLYASGNESSWGYCQGEDITCYYLPISPCSRNVSGPGQHLTSRPNKTDASEMLRFFWLQDYMLRPRHIFRRKQFELRSQLNVAYPCTTMHVRRGDSGMPRPPYRRYAAVQEYIDKAKLEKGDNIVLLTDDETTIEEVQTYHKDYNWIYLERPRNRGVKAGFHGHIPSGDEGFEMLAIETELRIASACQKIVCGQSGFMESLVQSMDAEGRNYTLYFVDTRVSKKEAMQFGFKNRKRAKSLFGAVEATIKDRQSTATDEKGT